MPCRAVLVRGREREVGPKESGGVGGGEGVAEQSRASTDPTLCCQRRRRRRKRRRSRRRSKLKRRERRSGEREQSE